MIQSANDLCTLSELTHDKCLQKRVKGHLSSSCALYNGFLKIRCSICFCFSFWFSVRMIGLGEIRRNAENYLA